jgi:hypothetical protein
MRPFDFEGNSPIWNLITDFNHCPPLSSSFGVNQTIGGQRGEWRSLNQQRNQPSIRTSNGAPSRFHIS